MKGKARETISIGFAVGFLFLAFTVFSAQAAVPQKVNYQGYLTDSSGAPVNGTRQMTFALYTVLSGGSSIWTETQTVSVNKGIYSVDLGDVMPINLPFDAQYFLGIQVCTDGSVPCTTFDPEMSPRQPLQTVPYSFRAGAADSAATASSIPWSSVTSTPTTLSGYGITDGVTNTTTVNGHPLSSNVTVTASDVGLGNVPNVDATNASNISSGTLSDSRLSANVTLQGNTFNGANQLLKLDGSGTIENIPIGSATPATGSFTILSSSGNINTTGGAIQTNSTTRIDNSGNLANIGTTQLHGVTYTWPASAGTGSYLLSTNGSGALSWVAGKYGKVAVVAQSGGDYTSPVTAMTNLASWCGTPSPSNPCLLKIMPGVYNIGGGSLNMQQYVDIEGSGEKTTKISGSAESIWPSYVGVVNGASNAEIRFITVENVGAVPSVNGFIAFNDNPASPKITNVTVTATADSGWANGINNNNSSPLMTSVTAIATGGTGSWNVGVMNWTSSPTMTNVTASASGGSTGVGVYNYSSSSPTMTDITAIGSGSTESYGIENDTSCSPTMLNVTATASGATTNWGIYNKTSSSPTMNFVTASASGGTNNYGIYNNGSSPIMINLNISASNGAGGTTAYGVYNTSSFPTMTNVSVSATNLFGTGYGIYNLTSGTIKINNSAIYGFSGSITNGAGVTANIGNTKLDGTVSNAGTIKCVGAYNGSYNALNTSCL